MATLYLGRNSYLGIGEESTWGTAVSRTHWFRLVSSSVKRVVEKRPRGVLAEVSGSANRRGHYIASDNVEGSVEILAGYEGIGLLLKHILHGAPTTSGPSGAIYTHAFKLGTQEYAGLTLEIIKGTGYAEVFEGCVVTKATLKIEAAGLMRITLDVIGQTSGGEASAGTPTLTTNELDVVHHHAGSLTFNSVSYAPRSVTWTVDNKYARRQLLGSKLTARPARSDFLDIFADVELEYDSDTTALFAALTADTQSDLSLSFAGAGSRVFQIIVHNAYLETLDMPLNGVGVLPMSLRLRGESDGTDQGFQVNVQNEQATATAA